MSTRIDPFLMRGALSLALLLAHPALSHAGTAPRGAGRIALIGLDGLTFELLDPLMAQGRLPNFKRLVDSGARAVLKSETPMRSPALWTTVATGQPRSVHEIYDFVTGSGYWPAKKRSSERRLVTSDMRQAPAIWQLLGAHGRNPIVVGWMNSWPAESIDGIIVAPYVALGHLKQSSIKGRIYQDTRGQTHPRELFDEIDDLVVSVGPSTQPWAQRIIDEPRDGHALFQAIPKLKRYIYTVHWSVASALTNVAAVEYLLKTRPQSQMVMTYFDGADTLGHRFWALSESHSRVRARLRAHGFDPKWAPQLRRRFGHAIEGYYELLDHLLGRLTQALGEDVTVVIVSDHGWGSSKGASAHHAHVPFDGEHRIDGVFIANGPQVIPGRYQDLSLYDIAPTLLYLSRVPVPDDLPGSVATHMVDTSSFGKVVVSRAAKVPPEGNTKASPNAPFSEQEVERLRSLGYVQ